MGHAPVFWITGIPASGKTSLANALGRKFLNLNLPFECLDGDALRKLYPTLGFSRQERDQHIRTVAHTASLLSKHGIISIVALVSPYRESRNFARSICPIFFEIYLNTSLQVCQARDPKQLYARAARGEILELTGYSAPYEAPLQPALTIDTNCQSVNEACERVYALLSQPN
jgi:adenylylsulfate kinase